MINKTFVLLVITAFLCSCKISKRNISSVNDCEEPDKTMYKKKIYEDFPREYYLNDCDNFQEYFDNFCTSYGSVRNRCREGKWSAVKASTSFDSLGVSYARGIIYGEEYFKKGLRDSIYRRFDNDGKIIYETTFKMGTGLWKEFHNNGKIYFEVETKDGYFTDTLKLYNDQGKLKEKRLYLKDSLVYHENFIFDENPSDNK